MRARKGFILAVWLIILAAFWLYTRQQGLGAGQLLERWLKTLGSSALGPLFLIGVYLVRPLLLLPITILTVFAGFLFGALFGSVYALLASLLSASVAFWVGWFFGAERLEQSKSQNFLSRLRARSFETVLISRLMFVPGDLVNYGAGFVRISFWAFLTASALGGLPGLLFGVLAGAALEGNFSFEGLELNASYLLSSAALLLLSLVLSFWLRRRASATGPWAHATSADQESRKR